MTADSLAQSTLMLIELLLPIQWFAAVRLPEGRAHVVADVSFIAEPVARAGREEHAGFSKAMVIMAASRDRVGDPCRHPVMVQATRTFIPVV